MCIKILSFGFTPCSVKDIDFGIWRMKPSVYTMHIWNPSLIKCSSQCKKEATMWRPCHSFVCDLVTEPLVISSQKLSHKHESHEHSTEAVVLNL
jgi:hypothetical protein